MSEGLFEAATVKDSHREPKLVPNAGKDRSAREPLGTRQPQPGESSPVPSATVDRWLRGALALSEKETPFPWQEEIFRRFRAGRIERALDIPTGLGKTAVMALWLVARATGAALPRRLAYVVDRRAVVDQATNAAETLRRLVDADGELKQRLGLGERSLPISTLRGQHVDNREWLEDPAAPAIIVGTVDMIGSRMLFEGYGASRKMRPYHAGLLGVDTLVVLDEAHLVPPFEKLFETIAEGTAIFGPRDETLRALVPPFRLLSLSATGRTAAGQTPFGLQDADLKHAVVRRRLDAAKHVTVHSLPEDATVADALADRAWQLCDRGQSPVRIIVFCDKRDVAQAAKASIERIAKGDSKLGKREVKIQTELFVGARRVFERQEASRRLANLGFIAGNQFERVRPSFVLATSAAEVGVDLDADHMVGDLVAWERMVQRLGRVNRRGDGKALVAVISEPSSKETKAAREKVPEDRNHKEILALADADMKEAVRLLLERLPVVEAAHDASPGAIRALKMSSDADAHLAARIAAASTPPPLRPALSRALIDAWSMTSLEDHAGRPEITPWLRGWVSDPPQTSVLWRTHLPIRAVGPTRKADIEAFFEAAPPHASEILETETYRLLVWLGRRVARFRRLSEGRVDHGMESASAIAPRDPLAVVLTPAGDLRRVLRLEDLDLDALRDAKKKKEKKDELDEWLKNATLVVDARVCGLREGLLDAESDELPRTVDDGSSWISTDAESGGAPPVPVVPFRVRSVSPGDATERPATWRESFRLVTEAADDGEPTRYLIVENAANEERRSLGHEQEVGEHQKWAQECVSRLALRLELPEEYASLLELVASLHDEGKRAPRWQKAFNARRDGQHYAKTSGPVNFALLDGYRHEFGSLGAAEQDPRIANLESDRRDLALHAIAAHHGFARPVIGISGCEDAPPSMLEERAREVALRFARLQKRWGPWGLAWWEALVRASDQQASRDNDNRRATHPVRGRT